MTRKIASQVAMNLSPGDLLLLEGDLGCGKTVFVQGLAQGLGISPRQVRSPTFSIVQEYRFSKNSKSCAGLCHVDLYRLSALEVRNLGLEEYCQSGNWIVAVEWADKAPDFFPSSALKIKFSFVSKQTRALSISGEKRIKKIPAE